MTGGVVYMRKKVIGADKTGSLRYNPEKTRKMLKTKPDTEKPRRSRDIIITNTWADMLD